MSPVTALPSERIPPAEGRLEHDPAESTLSVVRRSVEPPSRAPVIGSACGTRIRAHRRTRLCRRPTARAPRLPAKWPPRGMGVQRWSAYTGILIARCSTHTKTAITPLMADAVRRALLIGESTDPEVLDAPGMIVLGPGWRPESISPGLEEWLRDLPDGNWAASRLPTAVLAVAGRAARSATSTGDPAEVAVGSGIDPFGPLGGSARCTARCGRQ